MLPLVLLCLLIGVKPGEKAPPLGPFEAVNTKRSVATEGRVVVLDFFSPT